MLDNDMATFQELGVRENDVIMIVKKKVLCNELLCSVCFFWLTLAPDPSQAQQEPKPEPFSPHDMLLSMSGVNHYGPVNFQLRMLDGRPPISITMDKAQTVRNK